MQRNTYVWPIHRMKRNYFVKRHGYWTHYKNSLIFLNMFKRLKEARTTSQQIENINKLIKIIKRNQIENVELTKIGRNNS